MGKTMIDTQRAQRELVWRGELTVQRVLQLKEELVSALASAEQIRLHLVDVTEVDIAFLQLLCSAHRSASRMRRELTLVGPLPPALSEISQLGGFSRHVGCSHDLDANCLWKESSGS